MTNRHEKRTFNLDGKSFFDIVISKSLQTGQKVRRGHSPDRASDHYRIDDADRDAQDYADQSALATRMRFLRIISFPHQVQNQSEQRKQKAQHSKSTARRVVRRRRRFPRRHPALGTNDRSIINLSPTIFYKTYVTSFVACLLLYSHYAGKSSFFPIFMRK